jgi:UDP-glucose 4-epimerase
VILEIKNLFTKYNIGESVQKPLEYYDNNVVGTLRLLDCF